MPHTLTVTLSDPVYESLSRTAAVAQSDPAALLAKLAAKQFPPLVDEPAPGCGDVRRYFGAISVPVPDGWDNEQMDAALAREYADNHEPS